MTFLKLAHFFIFTITLITAKPNNWLTVTNPKINYPSLKTQMNALKPPQNYFEVTNS